MRPIFHHCQVESLHPWLGSFLGRKTWHFSSSAGDIFFIWKASAWNVWLSLRKWSDGSSSHECQLLSVRPDFLLKQLEGNCVGTFSSFLRLSIDLRPTFICLNMLLIDWEIMYCHPRGWICGWVHNLRLSTWCCKLYLGLPKTQRVLFVCPFYSVN